MDIAVILLVAALILGLAFWGFDRHLVLKQVEIDLKNHLGDLLVDRDSACGECKCCRQASVYAIKGLIRTHFKL